MGGELVGKRIEVVPHALLRELPDEQAVILNLESEVYFGLDAVAKRMWAALTAAPTVDDALQSLRDEFDVDPAVLDRDVRSLVAQLVEHGLVQVVDTGATPDR